MPLARKAVTFSFCQVAMSSAKAMAILLSKRMAAAWRPVRPRSCMIVHMQSVRPPAFCRLDAAPALGIEALAARFYGHAYDRHFHDSFAVGLTEDGHQAFHVRGARHVSTPGTAIVLMPGDVHDGEADDADGFAYRMLYLPQALVADLLADAAERPVGLPHFPTPLLRDKRLARAVAALATAMEQPCDPLTLHHL